MKISKYFTLTEVLKSDTARKKNIKNVPRLVHVVNATRHANLALDPVREESGPLVPSSWFRTPALNVATNGSARSMHLLGLATDIPHENCEWLLKVFLRINPPFDKIIWERNKRGNEWLHTQSAQTGQEPRRLVMTGFYNINSGEYDYESY